jgi:hypothetical protein
VGDLLGFIPGIGSLQFSALPVNDHAWMCMSVTTLIENDLAIDNYVFDP